jgi:hypothetical protein
VNKEEQSEKSDKIDNPSAMIPILLFARRAAPAFVNSLIQLI